MDHLVGILPTAYEVGCASLEVYEGMRMPALLESKSIGDALSEVYDTDAHFVMYYAKDSDGDLPPYYRCKKTVLHEIRENGGDLLIEVLGVDWDNPGHQQWDDDLLASREAQLAELMKSSSLMGSMYADYRSRAGYRFIFVLDEPIPVDEAEQYLAGLLLELKEAGVEADALSDWTRLFRLPFVVREGKNTWDDPYCSLTIHGNKTKKSAITPCDRGELLISSEAPINPNIEYPTDDEASELREYSDSDGRRKMTTIFRTFKKSLKDRKSYSCIFEEQSMADEGGRNLTMMSYIGEAVLIGMDIEGCNPEHIYALFLPAVLDFEADQDWRRALWTGVISIWNKEKIIHNRNCRVKLEKKELKKEGYRAIIDGMAGWDTAEELRDERAEEYVKRHMIASVGKFYFLMGEEGAYRSMPLSKDHIIPQIRQSAISDLIPTTFVNDKGKVSDISVLKIINTYSIPLRDIERIPDTGISGFIRQKNSDHPVLVLPLYRRNPSLIPEFNMYVDKWLRSFFGDNFDEGCRWIAYALSFEDGPMCGLSITGDQGAGKNMFVQGLAECLETPFTATSLDLTSQFQSGLLRSPFLWVDEGWPQSRTGLSPADNFRRVTSGGAMTINDKYMPLQKIFNPMRVIFTANNINVVQELASGKDLSPGDRDAIAIRLSHYDIGGEAARFLQNTGGRAMTSADGFKWIADDSGESDYIVAKHFLHLYEQKAKWKKGARFAVEGNLAEKVGDPLMFEMLTRHGKTPLVMETILHLYEGFDSRPGCLVEDGKLYVLISEIVNYLRDNNFAEAKIRSAEVADALQNLVIAKPVACVLPSRVSQGLREWYELDVTLLFKASVKFGYPAGKLMKACGGIS